MRAPSHPATRLVRGLPFFAAAIGLATAAQARAALISPVYGPTDDRQDLWQVEDARLTGLADSTVVIFPANELESSGQGLGAANARPLESREQLCRGERFGRQATVSAHACSGALVGQDLILTAGHCVPDAESCRTQAFVFGFSVTDEPDGIESGDDPLFDRSQVYRCRELLTPPRAAHPDAPDLAVVRLDRSVVGHAALAISRAGAPAQGTALAVIGHPAGLPTKVAAGGQVTSVLEGERVFYSDLDTFAGNSGSPVFDLRTGLIEGILVDGESDYEEGRLPGCRVTRRCSTGLCLGEKSTLVSVAAPYIPR
jgi:hypothetical protein